MNWRVAAHVNRKFKTLQSGATYTRPCCKLTSLWISLQLKNSKMTRETVKSKELFAHTVKKFRLKLQEKKFLTLHFKFLSPKRPTPSIFMNLLDERLQNKVLYCNSSCFFHSICKIFQSFHLPTLSTYLEWILKKMSTYLDFCKSLHSRSFWIFFL